MLTHCSRDSVRGAVRYLRLTTLLVHAPLPSTNTYAICVRDRLFTPAFTRRVPGLTNLY